MRRSRGLPILLFHTLFLICSLTLITALAFTGAGLLAILSVFVAIIAFFLLPLIPPGMEPVYVRRLSRRSFSRAPPRF